MKKHFLVVVGFVGLVLTLPARAEAPEDQIQVFLGRVPKFGDPAREAARRDESVRKGDAERGRAQEADSVDPKSSADQGPDPYASDYPNTESRPAVAASGGTSIPSQAQSGGNGSVTPFAEQVPQTMFKPQAQSGGNGSMIPLPRDSYLK